MRLRFAGSALSILQGVAILLLSIAVVPSVRAAVTLAVQDSHDPVRENQTYEYRIHLTNKGAFAETTTVRQELPEDISVEEISDGGSFEQSDTLRWENITVAPGGTRTLTVRVRAARELREFQVLRTTVTANGSLPESESTHVGTFHMAATNIIDDERLLRLEVGIIDSPDPVSPGQSITYIIRIENNELIRKTFSMQAILDEDTEFMNSSYGGRLFSGNEVDWDRLTVLGDNVLTVYLTVRVRETAKSGDSLQLLVRAGNDKETESTRVRGQVDLRVRTQQTFPYDYSQTIPPRNLTPPPPPRFAPPPTEPQKRPSFVYPPYFTAPRGAETRGGLSIDKSADRREVRPGDQILYTIRIRNNSTSTLTGITIRDVCTEGGIQTVRELSDLGSIEPDGSLLWRIDRLLPGEERTLRYRVEVDPNLRHGATLRNTVTLRTSTGEEVSASTIVRIVERLPRTGVLGLRPGSDGNHFLRPYQSKEAHSAATPSLAVWLLVGATGIATGGALGKRFFYAKR